MFLDKNKCFVKMTDWLIPYCGKTSDNALLYTVSVEMMDSYNYVDGDIIVLIESECKD